MSRASKTHCPPYRYPSIAFCKVHWSWLKIHMGSFISKHVSGSICGGTWQVDLLPLPRWRLAGPQQTSGLYHRVHWLVSTLQVGGVGLGCMHGRVCVGGGWGGVGDTAPLTTMHWRFLGNCLFGQDFYLRWKSSTLKKLKSAAFYSYFHIVWKHNVCLYTLNHFVISRKIR